jgi:hypothetical protein
LSRRSNACEASRGSRGKRVGVNYESLAYLKNPTTVCGTIRSGPEGYRIVISVDDFRSVVNVGLVRSNAADHLIGFFLLSDRIKNILHITSGFIPLNGVNSGIKTRVVNTFSCEPVNQEYGIRGNKSITSHN